MNSFFEGYGYVILAAIAVIILIVMATPLGSLVKSQITNIVDSFGSKTQSKLNATDSVINVRVSTANNKITLEWDAVKKEDKFKYQYKASNTSKDANWTDVKDVEIENDKSRKAEITTDSSGVNLTNKTKVEYKIYDSNDVLVASGIVIAEINGNTVDNEVNEDISKTDSFVGYYADTNGDGTVDGVIFADLAFSKRGKWASYSNGSHSYTAIPTNELKNYKVSKNNYNGKFGDKPVLKATGSGKDRFYVMALENVGSIGTHYSWYYSASKDGGQMFDYATATSVDFGTGRTNTATMIEKWNNKAYGEQDADTSYGHRKDLWDIIQEQVADGWFVPSMGEWDAFSAEMKITKENYEKKGLVGSYGRFWSSSQDSKYYIYVPAFSSSYGGFGSSNPGGLNEALRLATTF